MEHTTYYRQNYGPLSTHKKAIFMENKETLTMAKIKNTDALARINQKIVAQGEKE